MLTKQAIRSNIRVLANGELITKDQLITISEGWNENQEQFFRKMLQQGGIFTLKDVSYKIISPEPTRDSKGEIHTFVRDTSEE